MIVPMKKVTVIVQAKDSESAIRSLCSLGLVHVEHQQLPKGRDINSLQEYVGLLDTALGILSETEFKNKIYLGKDKFIGDWKIIANHVIESHKRLEQLGEYARNLALMISQWEEWGDFNPDLIKHLSEKGIYIRLYKIPDGELKNLPHGVIVKRLFASKGIAGYAAISRDRIDIPFNEVIPPKVGLERMHARLSEDARTIEFIKIEITKYAEWFGKFTQVRDALLKELEFYEALRGMGESGNLAYLTGYVPYDAANEILEAGRREKWGVVINNPSENDKVPTLIRNPKWVSVINPVFKLLEIVPGYRELDISLLFLVFFSIFFGMLIGDAGIGLIFLFLTALAQAKLASKLKDRSVFILFYMLSITAVIWGGLTGTFFGQEWLGHSFKPLLPALRNNKNIQAFCFFIGALHLSIAHLWRGLVKLPSLTALADAGWVLILWSGFFFAKTLILGDAFPVFVQWLFLSGIILVVFFTSFHRNFLKGIGSGLGSLLLNIVSSFTDIVSYIRLFAVGLASVAIADVFNSIAMDLGYSTLIKGIGTSLILLLGHGLNVVLGPMSVLVHGVRLNVLEFCSHVDIKWSGFSYMPLRENQSQNINNDYGDEKIRLQR